MTNKLLPVKDAMTNQVVAYRRVVSKVDAQNVAGVIVTTEGSDTPIVLSYMAYSELPTEDQVDGSLILSVDKSG